MSIITCTPTTLITGFLGAGKTTLINRLLAQKDTAKWAILVNEFGKIGIDGGLFQGDKLAVQEVSGGCICCTSQLPLQIALVRLLSEHKPAHLIIEPTGLAHPSELIEQLSQPHWQTSLTLNATICVLNAAQWQQPKYRTHEGYQAHVKYADIVVINRTDVLSDIERTDINDWISQINQHADIMDNDAITDDALFQLMKKPRRLQPSYIKVPLALANHQPLSQDTQDTQEVLPPYRYHDQMAGFEVGGWRLPNAWAFDGYQLQMWLLKLPNYARIKGIIHTNEGWLSINITPESVSIAHTDERDDSRLELILNTPSDWESLDKALMAFMMPTNEA